MQVEQIDQLNNQAFNTYLEKLDQDKKNLINDMKLINIHNHNNIIYNQNKDWFLKYLDVNHKSEIQFERGYIPFTEGKPNYFNKYYYHQFAFPIPSDLCMKTLVILADQRLQIQKFNTNSVRFFKKQNYFDQVQSIEILTTKEYYQNTVPFYKTNLQVFLSFKPAITDPQIRFPHSDFPLTLLLDFDFIAPEGYEILSGQVANIMIHLFTSTLVSDFISEYIYSMQYDIYNFYINDFVNFLFKYDIQPNIPQPNHINIPSAVYQQIVQQTYLSTIVATIRNYYSHNPILQKNTIYPKITTLIKYFNGEENIYLPLIGCTPVQNQFFHEANKQYFDLLFLLNPHNAIIFNRYFIHLMQMDYYIYSRIVGTVNSVLEISILSFIRTQAECLFKYAYTVQASAQILYEPRYGPILKRSNNLQWLDFEDYHETMRDLFHHNEIFWITGQYHPLQNLFVRCLDQYRKDEHLHTALKQETQTFFNECLQLKPDLLKQDTKFLTGLKTLNLKPNLLDVYLAQPLEHTTSDFRIAFFLLEGYRFRNQIYAMRDVIYLYQFYMYQSSDQPTQLQRIFRFNSLRENELIDVTPQQEESMTILDGIIQNHPHVSTTQFNNLYQSYLQQQFEQNFDQQFNQEQVIHQDYLTDMSNNDDETTAE